VVYTTFAPTVSSGGYNVSDHAAGRVAAANNFTDSGYTAATGDVFGVTGITFADSSRRPKTKPSQNYIGFTGAWSK
jgi:hypothetical protein